MLLNWVKLGKLLLFNFFYVLRESVKIVIIVAWTRDVVTVLGFCDSSLGGIERFVVGVDIFELVLSLVSPWPNVFVATEFLISEPWSLKKISHFLFLNYVNDYFRQKTCYFILIIIYII